MAARRTAKPCLLARILLNSLVILRGNPGRELEGPRGGGGAVLDGAPLHGGPGFGRRRPGRRVARSCGGKEKVEDCRFQRSPIFRARSDDDRKGETPADGCGLGCGILATFFGDKLLGYN